MLFSKTKVFRSVVVLILAISMIGGLVVFKGFALDEDARDSFTISSAAEETANDDANDVMEITDENADDVEANDIMEITDENAEYMDATDVIIVTKKNAADEDETGFIIIMDENAADEDTSDVMDITYKKTVAADADVMEITDENADDVEANGVMEITGENADDAEANDIMEIVDENADDAEANDIMEIVDENADDAQANDVIEITDENTVDADAAGVVEVADEEDNEEISDNDVENTQENHVYLPGECPENPIIISSVEDLEDFATDLEEGNDFSGKYFEIIDDIIVLKDNKFFSERLNKNGILFTGKFNGHIESNKGGFIYIYVKEIPQKVFLFEDLGQDAEIYMGFVLLTEEEEARIYSFSCP